MRPGPKVVKRCRRSECYGHRDTIAANLIDPNDPKATYPLLKSHPLSCAPNLATAQVHCLGRWLERPLRRDQPLSCVGRFL